MISLVTPNVSCTFPNISYFAKIMFGNVEIQMYDTIQHQNVI